MNRLKDEKSAYLRQHQKNPVHWFAWSDEAFAEAVRRNCPVFISIGYSTCHWCHVMERESFEDFGVASVLNDKFVSIKVDREEHPDVDHIYMTAVQNMGERGGWPLTVFVTPKERAPFFGGTYFPKGTFVQLLNAIAEEWRKRGPEIISHAQNVVSLLSEGESAPGNQLSPHSLFDSALTQWAERFDAEWGGFGGAPKFPSAVSLRVLHRLFSESADAETGAMIRTTLDRMAAGGIFDHVGGGFHRYSTDREWRVPHFEKMLYDNALLLRCYAEAYHLTRDRTYGAVTSAIVEYLERDLRIPGRGFAAAEDADSEGEEGRFYTWSPSELESVLSYKDRERLAAVFDFTPASLWEGRRILWIPKERSLSVRFDPTIEAILSTLRSARLKRVRPLRDEKILTGINALAIEALAGAGVALGRVEWKELAATVFQELTAWAEDPLTGTLFRRLADGERKFEGTLEDYAFWISAALSLYEATGEESYLARAEEKQIRVDSEFETSGKYWMTGVKEVGLFMRPSHLSDGSIPSGWGCTLDNLVRLSLLTEKSEWSDRADQAFSALGAELSHYPTAFPTPLLALHRRLRRGPTLTLPRSDLSTARAELSSRAYFGVTLRYEEQLSPWTLCDSSACRPVQR